MTPITERKQREKLEMRALILNTAMKLFLQEGFQNVSIRRLADEIEYSPATIYLYFKDKDEILYALHNRGHEIYLEEQEKLAAIPDPLERLKKHADVYFEFAMNNPEIYDLMFILDRPPLKHDDTAVHCERMELAMRAYGNFRSTVEACIHLGYLQTDNVDAATFGLWGLVHGMASLIIRQRCMNRPREEMIALTREAQKMLNRMIDVSRTPRS